MMRRLIVGCCALAALVTLGAACTPPPVTPAGAERISVDGADVVGFELAPDGRRVAVVANGASGRSARVVDRRGPGDHVLPDDARQFAFSGNGLHLAFVTDEAVPGTGDDNAIPDVYVMDLSDGSVELASLGPDGGTVGHLTAPFQQSSISPLLNGDGSVVAFVSYAAEWARSTDPLAIEWVNEFGVIVAVRRTDGRLLYEQDARRTNLWALTDDGTRLVTGSGGGPFESIVSHALDGGTGAWQDQAFFVDMTPDGGVFLARDDLDGTTIVIDTVAGTRGPALFTAAGSPITDVENGVQQISEDATRLVWDRVDGLALYRRSTRSVIWRPRLPDGSIVQDGRFSRDFSVVATVSAANGLTPDDDGTGRADLFLIPVP